VLALYSYDSNPDDTSLENLLRQSIELIARFPTIVAKAYAVKRHVYDGKSLYIHNPKEKLSVAENFLRMLRSDKTYTDEEAKLLDMMLMLHAEHGGGNNSAFVCRVLSSSGTDTYSAIAGR
jgi:citrate synthase